MSGEKVVVKVFAELIEDDASRQYRIRTSRRICFAFCRRFFVWGFGIFIPLSILLYQLPLFVGMPLERSDPAIATASCPVALTLVFFVLPYVNCVFRNRWRLTDKALHIRDEHFGRIRWRQLVQWRKERL